jgi:hypothetical protein
MAGIGWQNCLRGYYEIILPPKPQAIFDSFAFPETSAQHHHIAFWYRTVELHDLMRKEDCHSVHQLCYEHVTFFMNVKNNKRSARVSSKKVIISNNANGLTGHTDLISAVMFLPKCGLT